jgi:hypothetical protein
VRTSSRTAPRISTGAALTPDETARFAGVLQTTLGSRQDRDRNLAAWVAAVAAAPSGPLSIATIAAIASELASSATAKQLRHVIEHAPLDETRLRQRLVSVAPLASVLAFTVEHESVPRPQFNTEADLFSIHAVGPSWAVPIGWLVEPIPPADRDGEVLGVDDAEAAAVLRLLEDMRGDYAAVEPGLTLSSHGLPPVILQSESFGINGALRAALRRTVGEYVARVPGNYCDLRLGGDPLERVEPNRQLQDYFAPMPHHADPDPRELLDGSPTRRGREYAVPLRTDEGLRYAIVRPAPAVPAGVLLGARPERRARELGRLALEVGDTRAAARFRVSDLRHRNPDVLRRHALLMSILTTVIDRRSSGVLP